MGETGVQPRPGRDGRAGCSQCMLNVTPPPKPGWVKKAAPSRGCRGVITRIYRLHSSFNSLKKVVPKFFHSPLRLGCNAMLLKIPVTLKCTISLCLSLAIPPNKNIPSWRGMRLKRLRAGKIYKSQRAQKIISTRPQLKVISTGSSSQRSRLQGAREGARKLCGLPL